MIQNEIEKSSSPDKVLLVDGRITPQLALSEVKKRALPVCRVQFSRQDYDGTVVACCPVYAIKSNNLPGTATSIESVAENFNTTANYLWGFIFGFDGHDIRNFWDRDGCTKYRQGFEDGIAAYKHFVAEGVEFVA